MGTPKKDLPFVLFSSKTIKEFNKGTMLLREGERGKYSYMVVKGCLKSFVTDEKGKEHILQFAPEGWLISDMNSYLNDAPAVMNIAAIEDTEVKVIDKIDKEMLATLSQQGLVQLITKLQNSLIAANKRFISLLSASAETRYLDFIETYPTLYKRLPLKLIAAYLGITPEFLSRLRKKLAEKGKD
jgi:CRP/FNR family transcriptional regulator, anaerobic regulatory protein